MWEWSSRIITGYRGCSDPNSYLALDLELQRLLLFALAPATHFSISTFPGSKYLVQSCNTSSIGDCFGVHQAQLFVIRNNVLSLKKISESFENTHSFIVSNAAFRVETYFHIYSKNYNDDLNVYQQSHLKLFLLPLHRRKRLTSTCQQTSRSLRFFWRKNDPFNCPFQETHWAIFFKR